MNAGTVEFLLDDGRPVLLPRDEHAAAGRAPVTEMVTGIDLVQWQIRIARGEPLTLDPDGCVDPRGHAIECRIYAEDPDAGFLPSPGRIDALDVPSGPGIRDDSGVEAGAEIPDLLRPAHLEAVAWGADRAAGAVADAPRAPRYSVGHADDRPVFPLAPSPDAFETGTFTPGAWTPSCRNVAERVSPSAIRPSQRSP